jgi:putative DNA primase/helicase
LLLKRDGNIPNDLAALKGSRFVFCSEVEEGKRLAESTVKDLCGGDQISARFMRGEWFSFEPTFKLWVATNHKPTVRGTDDAIWSRIRMIPFTNSIPEGDRIPRSRLMEKIKPEFPGILAWGVRGCRDWRQFGLGVPDEVRDATLEYRGQMDVLGQFLEECCICEKGAVQAAGDLYGVYAKWAAKGGENPLGQKSFGVRLGERGFIQGRMAGGRKKWIGIRLGVEGGKDGSQGGSE